MSLSFDDVSHSYGATRALNGVDLTVGRGEIVCLFGASGCGKTTLLRVAAGLERLQKGTVSIDGATIGDVPAERRPVGLVFQDYALFPHRTVAQNVAFGLTEKSAPERKKIVNRELTAFDASEFSEKFPHELSGGQQQRAALARAFAREPKVMLLDEPFASLDVALRRRLRLRLRADLKARDCATLLVTHDPVDALAMGDRIAIMRAGSVIEVAAPAYLYDTPQTLEGATMFPDVETIDGECRNGVFHCVFGAFPTDCANDGPAAAAFRRGALSLAPAGDGAAIVVDRQFAGPDWRMLVAARADPRTTLLVVDAAPIEAGATVAVQAARAGVHIFPKTRPGG